MEYDVLRNVQSLVESNYIDGRPRHHLPSAWNPILEEGASIFFIVEHAKFVTMSPHQIQEIARHRNIVVKNVPQPAFDWSRETLSEFGGVSQLRDIQGSPCSCNTISLPDNQLSRRMPSDERHAWHAEAWNIG
jgi:hypothetical protein